MSEGAAPPSTPAPRGPPENFNQTLMIDPPLPTGAESAPGRVSASRSAIDPYPRREPGGDNPHTRPNRTRWNPHPPSEPPSSKGVRPTEKMPSLGISGAFPWPWTWFQVFRGPEARKRSGKPRPAPVSRPGSRLKSSESDPKTEAVEAPVVEHSWTAVRHRNRRSVANRDGFRRTGPQGAARRSFNRGLPIPCRHADLRGLGRPENRIVWSSRRNGTPRRDRYCFTKTKVEVNSLPSPFVPLVLVVIVLPSFETTMRLVA